MDPNTLQTLIGVGGAPVVTALVEVLIKPFTADKRFYPLGALALGIVWNLAVAYVLTLDTRLAALLGVLTGLAAAGFYSGGRTLFDNESVR